MTLEIGHWRLDTVNGGSFWLDGGVMFGVIPKTIWGKQIVPDELNRIPVAGHCILARNGRQTVLVDTGYGSKFAPLDRKFYNMEPGEPLLVSLEQLGVRPDDIDLILFSHLHFDHAGGVSRWDQHRRPSLVFSRALFVAGRIEWEDATSGDPEFEGAYRDHNLGPMADSGRLELIEDGAEVLPGLSVLLTGGHTRGHFAVRFHGGGKSALFLGDVCASRLHMRRLWNLAYDMHPVQTRRIKADLLADAADRDAWILWSHDPGAAASRVARDPKREFAIVESRVRL
jgi:glyoxylase-like metal-dependent hydrolase (beta-lactamase superfamily II)